MKKTLLCVLLILLTLSLTLVACKTEVSIIVEDVTLEKGEPVFWENYVTITVNGKKVENPVFLKELVEGDPSKAGICKYQITYLHNEQYYTREAFVTFTAGAEMAVLPGTHVYKVGDKIDWTKLVTVTVNGTEVENPTLNVWTLGNPNVAGDCEYTIEYTHNGRKISKPCTIHYDDHVRMVVAKEITDVYLGDEIDWSSIVSVYVDDVLKEKPGLQITLKKGNPNDYEICDYEVAYKYEGRDITITVRIRYNPQPEAPIKRKITKLEIHQNAFKIGDAIDWRKISVVYVDGRLETDFEISAEPIESGNPDKEGLYEYLFTVTVDGADPQEFTGNITFVEELPNPNDVTLLSALFNKDYDSYTFTYNYAETGNEQYYMRETDKVMLGATSVWQIDYEDVNVDPNGDGTITSNLFYYLTANNAADEIRLYREYQGENGKEWKYRKYSSAESANYQNYLPMAFTFYEYRTDIMAQWFDNVDGVHFKVKDVFLENVAEILFGIEDGQTYSRIVLTTDGENITSVFGEYTFNVTVADQATGGAKQVEITAVVELTWSDFEDTTVTLPDASEYVPVNDNEKPEYVDPTTGEELTADQQAALNEALNKTYQSITSSYVNEKGDMYFRYSGSIKLTPTASFISERELQQYRDWIISDTTQMYYCLKLDGTHCTVWQMFGDNGDFMKYDELEMSLTELATYLPICDFGFTADMFGYVNGVYVIKPGQIEQFKTKFASVIPMDGYTKFDVLSFTVKLDSNGNVTEWRLVADCIDADKHDFYWDLTVNFANFDNTTVTLPDVEFNHLGNITDEQASELNNALNADYSNVTIKDCVNDSTMYFMGEDVTVIGMQYDPNTGRYSPFTDIYKIDGDNYFEIIGGVETETTKAKFDEYVLNFDFTQIDVSKVKYDTEKQAYYIAATDIDSDAFVLYYKGFFDYQNDEGNGVNFEITAFSFTVSDGRVVSVTAYFDDGTVTASALLSNFGTTTVPQD